VPEAVEPARAVAELLSVDPTFADEPARLRRGLRDLLPDDDRAVHLLAVAAEVGVPPLLAAGQRDGAHQRLVQHAGLRPEIADWVLNAWSNDRSTSGEKGPPVGDAVAVRVAGWSDGSLLVAVLGSRGLFAAEVDPAKPAGCAWLKIATPQTPRSRDVAVAVRGDRGFVAWSDANGVFACDVRRQPPDGSSRDLIAEPVRTVAGRRAGGEPQYPVAVLATDDWSLDVFWTADGQVVRRSTLRQWSSDAEPAEMPSGWERPERISRLDADRSGAELAWLVALTDRNRVLVSRWDLARDDVTEWVPVPTSATVLDVAVAAASIVACTEAGELIEADAEQLFRGRVADFTARASGRLPVRRLSAAATSSGTWIVAVSDRGGVLARGDTLVELWNG